MSRDFIDPEDSIVDGERPTAEALPPPTSRLPGAPLVRRLLAGDGALRTAGRFGQAPWSGVCRVVADGQQLSQGTGFLVSARWVVTSAHVIVDAGANAEVTVELGGGTIAASYLVKSGYDGDLARDIALLQLHALAPSGAYHFQIRALGNDFFAQYKAGAYPVHVPGFPEDAPMIDTSGTFLGAETDRLSYRAPTKPGQSGAPVVYRSDAETWVLGLHRSRRDSTGICTALRFDQELLDWVDSRTN